MSLQPPKRLTVALIVLLAVVVGLAVYGWQAVSDLQAQVEDLKVNWVIPNVIDIARLDTCTQDLAAIESGRSVSPRC